MEEKYAVVTGADRGLGLALTTQLLERGYTIFAGQYMPEWQELTELKSKNQSKLILVSLDISSDESVRKASVEIKKMCPYINLLINNAGITGDIKTPLFGELDFDDMLCVYNVNTLGPLRVIHALGEHVLESEEKTILTISSEAGSIENCWREYWFAYGMSKAALNMQGAIVHNAIKEKGGRQILAHPGFVQSYMSGKLNENARDTPEECAKGLLELAIDDEVIETKLPIFKDFKGESLPW